MQKFGCFVFLLYFYVCAAHKDHPCKHHDLHCVDKVFTHELQCTPIDGKRKDTHEIKYLALYYPHANATIKYHHAQACGFDDYRINNFFVDRETNQMVLEVTFNKIEVKSDKSTAMFFSKGRRPVVTRGGTYIAYENISFTIVFFNVDGRSKHDMRDYEVFTYISDVDPPVTYTKEFKPKDIHALKQFHHIVGDWHLSLPSKFITQGPLFINNILPCNLKINVY